jgi:hypothetical protein
VTSRSGFEINGATALQSAHYAAGLLGGGLAYHATPKIDVMFGATYSPGRKSLSQPSTRLYTTGIRFHMRPLPAATVEENQRAGFLFPRSVARLGYTTNAELRAQYLLLAEGADFLERQRGNAARRHPRLPAQRVPAKKVFAFDLGISGSTGRATRQGRLPTGPPIRSSGSLSPRASRRYLAYPSRVRPSSVRR